MIQADDKGFISIQDLERGFQVHGPDGLEDAAVLVVTKAESSGGGQEAEIGGLTMGPGNGALGAEKYLGQAAIVRKKPGASFPNMLTIGRGRSCDVNVLLPSVSKMHAYFQAMGGQWTLTDQRSTTGTFVNGTKIAAKTPVSDGDRISFGEGLEFTFYTPSGFKRSHRKSA